jgi:hypothetical protein
MRSYQIIIIIGTILEILIVIDSSMSLGIMPYIVNDISLEKQNISLYGKIDIAFILYIIILIIAFAVKNTKVVGIISITFSIIILFVTNVWGIVVSALLLVSGIVALVYKTKPPRYNPDTGELIQ